MKEAKDGLTEDIKRAKVFFAENKDLLISDGPLAHALAEYQTTCGRSAFLRIQAGVVERCRICDEAEGGSCCGAGIEARYDVEMLVINLVLGAHLPSERSFDGSCLFLGPSGCTLKARDVICVNYLCPKILDQCPRERLSALQEAEGRELELLFFIHEKVRKLMKSGLP